MAHFDELLIRFEFSASVYNSDTTRGLQKIRRLIVCKINFYHRIIYYVLTKTCAFL